MLSQHLFWPRDSAAVFHRVALNRARGGYLGISHGGGETGESSLQHGDQTLALRFLQTAIGFIVGSCPILKRWPDRHHRVRILGAKRAVVDAENIRGDLTLVNPLRIADQHLHRSSVRGDDRAIHLRVEHDAGIRRHEALCPGASLRCGVRFTQQLAIQVPDRAGIDNLVRYEAFSVVQQHAGGFFSVKQNRDGFSAQNHVSAVFFD